MTKPFSPARCLPALILSLAAGGAVAQTAVSDAWARATVPAQKTGGAYLTVRSPDAAKLVAASSPAAARVELHTMSMKGSTMSMREMTAIDLPAGKAVNDFHVMLMDLKRPLKEGDTVALDLVVEHAGGKRETVKVSVPVKPLTFKSSH
jgi:copper(I)-binding protein